MLGVLEHERSRGVDGHRPGASLGVGSLAGMDGPGCETEFVLLVQGSGVYGCRPLAVASLVSQRGGDRLLEEEMTLPDFEAADDRGRRVTSRDLLGKWAVVWWYVKADTPG